MAILQDHLLVPSRTICSACSRLSMCVSGSTENVVLKRRQCPRHRIVLRQPLSTTLPPPVVVVIVVVVGLRSSRTFAEIDTRGGPLLSRGDAGGVLRRPPKDVGDRDEAGRLSIIIQRHPAAALIFSPVYYSGGGCTFAQPGSGVSFLFSISFSFPTSLIFFFCGICRAAPV